MINSTKHNLKGVRWKKFDTTWQNKDLKIVNGATGKDHTAGQMFGTVNAVYFHNGPTKIKQIFRNWFAHISAQNEGKIVSKC